VLAKPFSKRLLILAGVVVVAFLLLNYAILPWYVNHGETMSVPTVVGMHVDSARTMLESRGLEPVQAYTRPDVSAPLGVVVAQNPERDAVVKLGRRVYLTVSGGEAQVIVPPLRGRSVRDARFTLERSGLRMGDVSYALSDAFPENTILEQSAQPGMKVPKGTLIRIVVSRGRVGEQTTVPDFSGKSVAEAERMITRMGLKLGNITYQSSFDLVPNTVVDQFPRPGESVGQGQTIDLFVVKAGKPKEEIEPPRE
jgi:serine/threonine-protein kinase